jgi:hypothetical protein
MKPFGHDDVDEELLKSHCHQGSGAQLGGIFISQGRSIRHATFSHIPLFLLLSRVVVHASDAQWLVTSRTRTRHGMAK